jgi:uncharacterized protein (DUF697 family)
MLKTLKQVRAAFSMLNPEEMRRRAAHDVHIGLVATGDRGYDLLEQALVPADSGAELRGEIRQRLHRASDSDVPPQVDIVLYEPGLRPCSGAFALDREAPEETAAEIVSAHEDQALALARHFPAFRRTVIDRSIQAVARENALFAVATALPDIVPNFVELPWALGEFASDTVFITANQVRMAFLIAAATGHQIGFAEQKGAIATIVAAAFGWRALARELVGKIPFGGGLIPKGAIAYAGTFAVGKALERAYINQPLTREEQQAVYQQAYQQGLEVARELRKPA